MRLAVLIFCFFVAFVTNISLAENVSVLKTSSNVSLKDLRRFNLSSFQNPEMNDETENKLKNGLSATRWSYVKMIAGYYWWVGRYITFDTSINGRRRTGYILLSKNCKMRRRSIAHLYNDTWRPGQFKYFSNTRNPRRTFRCRVLNITVR